MTHPYFEKARHPRVFAHRGLVTPESEASGVWDNTAAAFATAHAAGVEYIETDCRVTADGDVVLFHDETLQGLTGDSRAVADVSTRELTELYSVHGGLMTVADALSSFPDIRFNIDVKTDAAAEPLGPILAAHTHRVLISSFSDSRRRAATAAVQRAGAAVRPAASAGSGMIVAMRALSTTRLSPARLLRGIDALQIPEKQGALRVFVPSLVDAAHQHGVEVHLWTINDPDEMRRLVSMGADGIVSDRADVAIKALTGI